jgi:outer membrane lipoprotein carrier protein
MALAILLGVVGAGNAFGGTLLGGVGNTRALAGTSKATDAAPSPSPSATPLAETSPGASPSPAPAAAPSETPGPQGKAKRKKAKKTAAAAVAPVKKPNPIEKTANLPPVLQEVEAKYGQAETLQANFSQVNDVAALKTKKISSGVIMVKRPDKLRWETLKPDMNLLVSDGRHFWFYTPPFDEGEHGQVIEKPSSQINSKLANALLSGRFSVAREMKIEQESPSRVRLIPKPRTAGTVVRAEIEIDPVQKIIEKVTLEHKGGNRSEITLSKIELGKAIGDEAFLFTPPPNTDKVEQ